MGVWIETKTLFLIIMANIVTPFVGVWIETPSSVTYDMTSHPSWVCGLKRPATLPYILDFPVTPFVGVWIETAHRLLPDELHSVTPFVGVWIET